MSRRDIVIAYARSQVGYPEKNDASALDSFTVKGNRNYTKYARDVRSAGLFDGMNKQGAEWCATFVNRCIFEGWPWKEAVEAILCQTGPYAASCTIAARYFKEAGRFDNTPKLGDQAFFNVDGTIGHTGIVVEVGPDFVVVVEGNNKNMVTITRYPIGDSRIAGYGHPRYEEWEKYVPPETEIAKEEMAAALDDGFFMLLLPTIMPGEKGPHVAMIQGLLMYVGCAPGKIDGEYGPKTKKAIGELQKKIGANVDYEFGPETAAKAMPELFVDIEVTDDESEEAPAPGPPVIPAEPNGDE